MTGLKRVRESYGLTHRALAEEAGLSPTEISKLENGVVADPRLSTFEALGGVFGMGIEALVDNMRG